MAIEDTEKPPNAASATTLAAITQPGTGIGTLAQKQRKRVALWRQIPPLTSGGLPAG